MEQSPRVLLVEDDSSVRAMLGLSLRKAGISVDTAADGEEALRLLSGRKYDCLLTDAWMLPMDGFDLARRAARLQPGLRILMISAAATATDIEGTPIERIFPKPLAVESLASYLIT